MRAIASPMMPRPKKPTGAAPGRTGAMPPPPLLPPAPRAPQRKICPVIRDGAEHMRGGVKNCNNFVVCYYMFPLRSPGGVSASPREVQA